MKMSRKTMKTTVPFLLPWIRALIELKALPAVDKGRAVRAQVAKRLNVLSVNAAPNTSTSNICSHGRDIIAVNRVAQDKVLRLGCAVLNFQAHTEKEEQKRIERLVKD
jgi:hypothetical protein